MHKPKKNNPKINVIPDTTTQRLFLRLIPIPLSTISRAVDALALFGVNEVIQVGRRTRTAATPEIRTKIEPTIAFVFASIGMFEAWGRRTPEMAATIATSWSMEDAWLCETLIC
jgi:hypothetical protein